MNIFNYIENTSHNIALKIGKDEGEDNIELYEYSIFLITSYIFTTGVGVILALIFGYLIPYIVSHITFVLLRRGSGGYHCETFRDCFITTNTLYIIGSIGAILTQSIPEIMWFLSLLCGIFVMPICPKPSKNSPSRGYSEDIRFRKKYRNALLLLIILSLFCINNINLITTSISCGIFIVCFITSSFGEHLLNFIWRTQE